MERYNVVFRYTKEAGGYHGVMTSTSFSSKEEFDKWYTPEIRAREEIVEEGITDERAVELVHQTPFACRIAASIQEATDPDGKVDKDILKMQIKNALFAEGIALRS